VNTKTRNITCKHEQYCAAIHWNNSAIYGFFINPTAYERCLVDAINSLPPICRKTVILFVFERIPRKHIAAILHMSLPAVRFLIHRSGLLLREYLSGHGRNSTPDLILNRIFADWPYSEYAQLVRLRKSIVFLKRPYSKL
jgi:hypothetical protein